MMLWVRAVGIMLANALVLGSEPRMPPDDESLESPESLELTAPPPEFGSPSVIRERSIRDRRGPSGYGLPAGSLLISLTKSQVRMALGLAPT